MEIKYVGFYDILREGKQYRSYSLAAARKMDFISSILVDMGFHVRYVSLSHVKEMGNRKIGAKCEKVRENVILQLPPSREAKNKLDRIYRVLASRVWLFMYLLRYTKKGETIIVYHNYSFALPICLAQKIKGFRILLEVEEKYEKVWKLTKIQKIKERMLLKYVSENSLVVSEVLAQELKLNNPVISYGSYNVYQGAIKEKCCGETINLVLTGSIDKDRGSGFIAVEMMKYLPEKYTLKISGSVAEKDKDDFFALIDEVNAVLGREACCYLGTLNDREYEKLLLEADIALNPQKEGDFGNFVFPSKILTYLSYGLPVVSTRGESIVKSKIADLIELADSFDAKSVAEAVMYVKVMSADVYTGRLQQLKKEFSEQLYKSIFGGTRK